MQKMFLFLSIFILQYQPVYPGCSTFCFSSGDTVLMGNTLDWYVSDGIVVVNKRNVTKTSLWYSNPTIWTSKYGSITVNQWGREFPSRGMNEAGLAIGEMTLEETRFSNPDFRTSITLLQWIQYQLDNCATVDEVIASDQKIRINQGEYTSHFFVADKNGNCVTMEWINGRLVYHTTLPRTPNENAMPVKALTNEPYSEMIEHYKELTESSATGQSSLSRFYRIWKMIENFNPSVNSAVEYAFSITQNAGPGDWTKWRLVFDLTNLRLYFKTSVNKQLRHVDFSAFDFECSTPVKMIDVNDSLSGNLNSFFIEYNYDINRRIFVEMTEKIAPHFGVTSREVIDIMSGFPETTTCAESSGFINNIGHILDFELYQNYPNPFNSGTRIKYSITQPDIPSSRNRQMYIQLKVFDTLGTEVACLVSEYKEPGDYEVAFKGERLASGIYPYVISISPGTANLTVTKARKMVVMK